MLGKGIRVDRGLVQRRRPCTVTILGLRNDAQIKLELNLDGDLLEATSPMGSSRD